MTHASFLRRRLMGVADITLPTLVVAVVSDATPTQVTLTWSEAMNSDVPAAAAFTVSGHTVSGHTYVDSTHSYLTVDAFVNGEAAQTLAYTAPGSSKMRDLAGNLVANFSGTAITNNVAGASSISYWTELGYGAVPEDRVDSNGRVVLQKHASAPIIYVDPDAGNNSWDGLAGVRQGATSNGPKLTLFAALQTAAAHANFGCWVLIKAGSDIGTSFTTLLQTPQGVDAQYPALISTFDQGSGSADDVTWRNTALYRTGVWNMAGAAGVTFNSTQNPAGRKEHKWLVIENMRSTLATASSSYSVLLAGPANYVLFENCVFHRRMFQLSLSLYNKLLADQGVVIDNVHTRHCGFWKGIPQGIFTDKGANMSMDLCVVHSCGYSGTNRDDVGQVQPPSSGEHNVYVYAANFKATRTIFSDGANHGISSRRGAEVRQCLFADNASHLIIAGASTDTNEDYPEANATVTDCVFSGMNYINGVGGLAGGYAVAVPRLDNGTVEIADNIVNNINRLLAPNYWYPFVVTATTSTAAHIANHRFVAVSTVSGTLTSASTTWTNTTRSNTGTPIWDYASGMQVRFSSGAVASTWQVGDTLTSGSWTGTIDAIASDVYKQFDGKITGFDSNIMRNSVGTVDEAWQRTITDEDGGALNPTITSFVTSNNVYDCGEEYNGFNVAGSNVTYASVSGTYLAPTRDAETYASTLGYGSSKAWLDVAVQAPTTAHCVPALNYVREGFNMAAL